MSAAAFFRAMQTLPSSEHTAVFPKDAATSSLVQLKTADATLLRRARHVWETLLHVRGKLRDGSAELPPASRMLVGDGHARIGALDGESIRPKKYDAPHRWPRLVQEALIGPYYAPLELRVWVKSSAVDDLREGAPGLLLTPRRKRRREPGLRCSSPP